MEKKHKVLIMRCDNYDAVKNASIVKAGMQELGVTPSKRILLKPNVVLAHPEIFPHAFTRSEFLDGVISATKELAKDVEEIAIDVGGDFSLAEVQAKTRNFEFCLERVDDYFDEKSNLSCTVGAFPEKHSPDYCWGGCPGALQEAMQIVRGFSPDGDKKMEKIRYVVGKVDEPLNLADDERVIFAGSCTSWQGKIDGEHVKIESSYQTSADVDEEKTQSNDMLLKIMGAQTHAFLNRSSRYIHVPGCPLSVGQHVNYLAFLGKISNPNLDPRMAFQANISYYKMRFHRFASRFLS